MFEEHKNSIEISSHPYAHERRRHSRYPFTATAEIVEAKSQMRVQGRTSDLSLGGCYVDTMNSFPVGSIVKMRLTREARTFEAQAEVVYSLLGMGIGLKFTEVDPEQFRIVEKWLAELSGEMLPEPELQQPSDQSCPSPRPGDEVCLVLNDLITELMRQGILSDAKCRAMLQKLNRTGRAMSNSARA